MEPITKNQEQAYTQDQRPYTPRRYETDEEMAIQAKKYANKDFPIIEKTLARIGQPELAAKAYQALFEIKYFEIKDSRDKALNRQTLGELKIPTDADR